MIKTAKIRHYVHYVPHRGGMGGTTDPWLQKMLPYSTSYLKLICITSLSLDTLWLGTLA